MARTKETRRLDKLKDESRNIAKTYKLPLAALRLIEKAGKIHGQQSRAIQVGVELLWWQGVGIKITGSVIDSILETPQIGKTYKLTPRTVALIEALAKDYGTQGNVLAAVAFILSRPDPRGGDALKFSA